MKSALEGIRVLDMTTAYSGPIGTMLLADYGADVIKIESPRGELARDWEPKVNGVGISFAPFNRNKKGITLNTKSDRGKEIFLDLVKTADVVVENFRGGTLEKMGLTYEVMKGVNPRIIVASLSGFGETGPFRKVGCYSMLAEAMSGVMSMTGSPDGTPYTTGVAFGDSVGGMMTVMGVLMALIHRERTGEGQYVDVAMVDSLIYLSQGMISEAYLLGKEVSRIGNRDTGGYPYDSFKAKDGYCALTITNPNDWSGFAKACGLEEYIDDPRFVTNELRFKNADQLHEMIENWSSKLTRAEIEKAITEAGEGYAPILSITEMQEHEQVKAREMVIEVEDANFGKIREPGFPIKMSKTPGNIRNGAPLLGIDNEDVYSELGYSKNDLNQLKEEGII